MPVVASNVFPLRSAPALPTTLTFEIPLTSVTSLQEIMLRLATAAEMSGLVASKLDQYGATAVISGVCDVMQAFQASILSL